MCALARPLHSRNSVLTNVPLLGSGLGGYSCDHPSSHNQLAGAIAPACQSRKGRDAAAAVRSSVRQRAP